MVATHREFNDTGSGSPSSGEDDVLLEYTRVGEDGGAGVEHVNPVERDRVEQVGAERSEVRAVEE